jgi:hypothetical protein
MSKREGPAKIRLSDFKDRKGVEGAIDVEADDGTTFRIPPPELWDDDVVDLLRGEKLVDAARLIMGGDNYDGFRLAGGSANLLMAIIKEQHGVDPGE